MRCSSDLHDLHVVMAATDLSFASMVMSVAMDAHDCG
ncbi:MAG: hypothetical protein CM1200mP30_25330 [Pseudomonadota bacterium]|nr:MAG: hypothetical protein CM1200mP30_25330 [Pseudomonadota bacterium]